MKPSAPSSIAEGLVAWRPSGRETQERHPRSRRVWWHGAHPGVRHKSAILDRGGLGPPAGRKSRRSTMQPQPSACARQPPRRRPSRRSDFTPRSRRRRIAESRSAAAEPRPGKNLPAKTSRQKPPGKNAALLRAGSPGEAPRRRQAPSFQTARPWPPAFFPPARRRPRARPWWKRAWSHSCRPQQPRAWADSRRGRWRKAG